jgi:WD40 repeat protein
VVGDTIDGDMFSPDGRLVAVLSRDSVQVWDVETGDLRSTLPHDGYVRMASFSADGRSLVTQGDEPVARVWDVSSGEVRHTLEFAHPLVAAATSPDGRIVLTMQQDGTASLLDAQTGVERFLLDHGCNARDAWFIADGAVAVTWSRDAGSQSECGSKVMLWDVATGEERATMGTADVESLGFSADGTLMFTTQILRGEYGSPSSLVRVWDAETGEAWTVEPFVSQDYVRTPTFSPDATSLLTASGNRAVVWAVGGELLQSAIRAATTACLTPEFRRQNLGESDADARRKYEACERQHGRE